jgi:opacity protein-like surface antigen
MRNILLACAVLAVTTTNTAAQTYVGPWQPKPTIGVAAGAFGAITNNGDAKLIPSATLEVPFSNNVRIRVEAARSTLPIVAASAPDSRAPTDTAHIERLTISVAALRRPGAPISAYAGIGVGLYKTTFDVAPKPPTRVGGHVYVGAELPLSDSLTLDAEVGIQGFKDDPWYQRNLIPGEAVIRLKLAL